MLTPKLAALLRVRAGDPLALPGGSLGDARVARVMSLPRVGVLNGGFAAIGEVSGLAGLRGRPDTITLAELRGTPQISTRRSAASRDWESLHQN